MCVHFHLYRRPVGIADWQCKRGKIFSSVWAFNEILYSTATRNKEGKLSLLFMGKAPAACHHASLSFQHHERRSISKWRWQEAEGCWDWALCLSVSDSRRLLVWLVLKISSTFSREILENKNATFHENGTLSFVPVRYSIPIPERSVGDPRKDIIFAANLPLLGLSSATAGVSPFAALAFSTLAMSTKAEPILNLTVHDFLWGYQDNLVSLANTVLPDYINFERFGLMDRVRNFNWVEKLE